jgi:hypothetical protein
MIKIRPVGPTGTVTCGPSVARSTYVVDDVPSPEGKLDIWSLKI